MISTTNAAARGPAARRVLVVDDHASIRELLATWARQHGYDPGTAADGASALAALERESYDLVISDVRMPDLSGIELLRRRPQSALGTPFVFMTAFGTVPEAVQALHAGAIDYVTKPFNVEDLFARIESRLQPQRNAAPAAAPTRARAATSGLLVGHPDNLAKLYALLEQVAPSRSTVFINGPSGVGKELVAAELHGRSHRSHKPFVRVNCPAIPKELQESELFGHEKGAFTGANRRRDGKFFHANGGSILLDEISETTLAFQSKLLRVLQEREYERVGGNEIIRLDVRLVATSNRDMADLVARGKFRDDLFYRLNVVPIEIAPLCERRDDIPYLVHHFIGRFCDENQRARLAVSDAALAALVERPWSGNVRQLQNVCERAVVLARGEGLEAADFFLHLEIDSRTERLASTPARAASASAAAPVERTVAAMEQQLILRTVRETRANRTEAARRLGISVRTLRNKLNEYRGMGIAVDTLLETAAGE